MILIAVVDSAWAIGRGDGLLVKIPRDRKLPLEEALGKTVIIGRKTFLDLPGQQSLYDRRNVMLSRSPEFAPKGVTVCHSIGEVLREVQELPRNEVFVCENEGIYRGLLPYADSTEITKVDYPYDGDRFFPDLDRDSEWELTQEDEEETYFNSSFSFCCYERKSGDMRIEQVRENKT